MGKTFGFIYNEHNGDNLFRYEGKRLIGQFIGSDFKEGCDCNYYFERRYGIRKMISQRLIILKKRLLN